MSFAPVTAQEERMFRAMWNALAVEGKGLEPEQWLAAVAHLLGHIVAHQDGHKFTFDAIVQMIVMNVREGNHQAFRDIPTAGNA